MPLERAPDLAAGADDGLGELRTAFNKRLRTDRRRLVTLRAMFVHRQNSAPSIVEELHFISHRMCGAAAIFGCSTLAVAAQASIDEGLVRRKSGGRDKAAFVNLDALIELLAGMDHDHRQDRRRKKVQLTA